MQCKICNKEFNNARSLAKHIASHNITSHEYFDRFLSTPQNNNICPVCGEIKEKFRNITVGYAQTCSTSCSHNYEPSNKKRKLVNVGRKQSPEVIENRIKNTDQKSKEEKRKKTLLERYGCEYISQITEVRNNLSIIHKGTKKPRTKEHQQKIIDAKIRNGTTSHTPETSEKIRNTLIQKYQQDSDPPVYLPKGCGGGGRNYDRGYIHGFYYRSSYEKQFIITCHEKSIEIVSAETKEYRVPYYVDGKRKFYYPDFYLPKYNAIIEIKPSSMYLVEETFIKLDAGATYHENYIILTEEELFDLNLQWVNDIEYLLSPPEQSEMC